ncbi:hypothetical protein ACHAXT_006210 [Thalassiosira profunda]
MSDDAYCNGWCRDECAAFDSDSYDEEEEVRQHPPMKPALKMRNPAFDYYGNPIPPPARQAPNRYSEFLEEPPPAADYDEEVEEGCLAEFGHFLSCGAMANEHLADDAATHLKTPRGQPSNVAANLQSKLRQRELQALQQQLVQEKTAQALLEFELRSELAHIRRQTAEMEEAYRREIANEVSGKVVLQAQLQARLVRIMEERMRAESEVAGLSGKMTKLMALPAPVEEKTTILTSTPKTSYPTAAGASNTTPFGMGVVVESLHSHDPSCDACSEEAISSPTGFRSPKAADPVAIE